MKQRLVWICAVLSVALVAPAAASADIYVSAEAQRAMNERGYTVEPWQPPITPPAADKYCPGQKKTGRVGQRKRNSNGGTQWHHGLAGTFCYRGNGDRVWSRLKERWFGAPSTFFERAWGPAQRFKRGTLWSTVLIKERINGQPWQSDKIWSSELFLNPNVPNGTLKIRTGGRVTGGD